MEERSLFVKLDKHEQVNVILKKIEDKRKETVDKIKVMNEIIEKENQLLAGFEESLKKIDSCMVEANSLLNAE